MADKKQGIGWDRWIELFFTFGLLITSAIYACVAIRQLGAMKEQADQARVSANAAMTAADAAARQADAAAKSLDLAKLGIDTQVRVMKDAYRAKILFTDKEPPQPDIVRDGPTGALIHNWAMEYQNVGRGIANDMRFAVEVVAQDGPRRPEGKDEFFNDQPGAETTASPLAAGERKTFRHPDTSIGYISPGQPFSIQTVVWFVDEFGDSHSTSHCIVYPLDKGRADNGNPLCAKGNYAR